MSDTPSKNIFSRIWQLFWSCISWLRIILINGVFLIFLWVVISSIVENQPGPILDGAPLHIAPNGILVDQVSYSAPDLMLLSGAAQENAETNIRDLIQVINKAANDSRVSAIILRLDLLRGGGFSKIAEVGEALNNFRKSDKPIIAYADSYSQKQYLLASYADEIYLHNMGRVVLTGFGMYRNYYKNAIDKLDVNFHIFKVGNYKDFVEPYTRDSMSETSRSHNEAWVTELWNKYTLHVETSREIEPGGIDRALANIPTLLAENDGSPAKLAKTLNLVDHTISRVDRMAQFIKRFGKDPSDQAVYKHISYNNYFAHMQQEALLAQGNIGLINAVGTIWDGSQPEGTIGGDSLSRLIRKARNDKDLKALVIRVDSGGGSAFASELIRQEIAATRESGLPVIVSMGSLAASGGYWLATAADEIWATPTTLTGSIGVFSLLPTFEKPLAKIGITTDGFGTTDIASGFRPDMPLHPTVKAAMQNDVEYLYRVFLDIVATARMQSVKAVHEIAQGRVWTGQKAQDLGLVDRLGYLEEVIAAAAEKGGVQDNFHVKVIQRDLTPQEQILRALSQGAQVISEAIQFNAFTSPLHNSLIDLPAFKEIEQAQALYLDPKTRANTYAHCLDCVTH